MHGRRNRKKKRREMQGLPYTLSRMKLLRFHDNVRPTYFGTFSKRSAVLSGRRPLRTDQQMFDYEVDSDAEWEDEGEGEELSDSEGEKEKEKEEEESEEEEEVCCSSLFPLSPLTLQLSIFPPVLLMLVAGQMGGT
jgi:hypothetical protein